MNCVDARESFADLLDQEEGAPKGPAALHVASCESCSSELDYLRAAAAGLAALEVLPAPAGFTDGVMAKLGPPPTLWQRTSLAAKTGLLLASLGVAGALGLAATGRPATGTSVRSTAGPQAAPTAGASARPDMREVSRGVAEETVDDSVPVRSEVEAGLPASASLRSRSVAGASQAHAISSTATPSSGPAAESRRGSALGGARTESLDRVRSADPLDATRNGASLERPFESNPKNP